MHLIRIFGTMLHVVFKLIYFISNEQKGRHDFHFPLIRAQYWTGVLAYNNLDQGLVSSITGSSWRYQY